METQENKIIGEKINALGGLPLDYEVNLESKWTQLEAALDGNKKKKVFPYWWAAAVLLLVTLSGTWFLTAHETKQYSENRKNTFAGKISFPLATLSFIQVTDEPLQKRNYVDILPLNATERDTFIEERSLEPVTENMVIAEEKVEIPAEPAAEKNITKKRFTECDFTEGLPPGTTYSQPPTASRSLRFRLGKGRQENTTVQNNSKWFAIKAPL